MLPRAFAAVALAVAFSGCLSNGVRAPFSSEPCGPVEPASDGTLPVCIRENADAFLRYLLGKERAATQTAFLRSEFDGPPAFCTPDSCTETARTPHYRVLYHFADPGAPFVDVLAEIRVALNGTILDPGDAGLPDCIALPAECKFPIDEQAALRIARQNGLPAGVKPWATSFHFYFGDPTHPGERGRPGTFVWGVSSTLAEPSGHDGGHGKSAIIDGNDGRFYDISNWSVQY